MIGILFQKSPAGGGAFFYLPVFKLPINNVKRLQVWELSKQSLFLRPIYNGPVAQLNRAFDYGSKGFRFES